MGSYLMIKGQVSSFLPEGGYGFIKGEDRRDYYFSLRAIRDKSHIDRIAEGAVVEFEQKATPKGYRAENISIHDSRIIRYDIPDEVLISKSVDIKGWDVIERGEWVVFGNSRNSPDDAKRNLIHAATLVGANALVESEYFKTTGSERGTGDGTYHYTIHNFKARLATVAKKNMNGSKLQEELTGLNQQAAQLKQKFKEENQRIERGSRLFSWMIWSGGVALIIHLWMSGEKGGVLLGIGVAAAVLGSFFYETSNQGDWLQHG